jgi:hypothetical protein
MIKDKKINFGSYSLFSTLKSLILIFALLFLLKMYFEERGSRIEQQTLIEASADELKTWKNKNGENLAKIQVLETRNEKTFLGFKTKDSTIQELQALVKRNRKLFKNDKGSASIIKSETNIDETRATVVSKDSVSEAPIYKSQTKNYWYSVDVIAKEDSTNVKLKTFHSISLVMGSEGQGFLKKRKTFATAKDNNPFSDIKDMRIYNITENKKSFAVGPYAGLGISGSKGVVRTGWQVGFGVTYKLFEF